MSKIVFTENAWIEYIDWQKTDKKILKRVNDLLKDIQRDNFDGIGKPEPLRNYEGCWSRRIDDKNRLVYKISENCIEIIQCKGHYGDK